MIGVFGRAVFETSDRRVLTLRDLARDISPRLAVHDLINTKPKTEFIGPGLSTITFSIQLQALLGVSVRGEIARWEAMAEIGEVAYLIIGERPIGANRWIVSGISEAYGVITNRGGVVSASLDVSLQEYV